MVTHLSIVADILHILLHSKALGMKGAMLKQLVAPEFEHRSGISFKQAFAQYPKFVDVLKELNTVVHIQKPDGPGDVTVFLRTEGQYQDSAYSLASTPPANVTLVRPEIWIAFSNADASRLRFFHRGTEEVVHYVPGTDPQRETRVSNDKQFIKLDPVPANDHSAWMMEFLEKHPAVPNTIQTVARVIAQTYPYSSQLNREFSTALGEHGQSWRNFRTAKIVEYIHNWMRKNGIQTTIEKSSSASQPFGFSSPKAEVVSSISDSRTALRALIDGLDDRELSQILVPANLLARFSTMRKN